MSKLIKLVQGDDGPEFVIELSDKVTGALLDLTGLISAEQKFRAKNTDTVLSTQVLTVYGLPGNGQLQITWGAGDLDVDPGLYEGEVELTMTGPKTITPFDIINYTVRAQF